MKLLPLVSALALLVGFTAAESHTHLRNAAPADGSVVTTPPANIVLTFSEAARLTAAWIQNGDEDKHKLGPLPEKPATEVTIAVSGLTPGNYVVSWRAVGQDGHVMPGQMRFTLAPGATADHSVHH